MTILLHINTGTSPNQGNGDTIRAAFNKVNYNFELLKAVSVLATTDTLATLTNLSIQGTLDVVGTASFTTKVLTLANNSSNSTGAGLVVFDQTTPASILYNSNAGTWNFNKPVFGSAFYADNSPVLTAANIGDINFTNDIISGSVIISTVNTNEDIRIDPNGSGQLVISNTSILFDAGLTNKPTQHLLYTAPNALPVGLGINTDNDSLRIVGDAVTPGIVADFGLYNGAGNTWTSVALVDYLGGITASSLTANSFVLDNLLLQVQSSTYLTLNGTPVLPFISTFVPGSSSSIGTSGQLAYRDSNLYVCTSNTNWIKILGLTGNQWNQEALFIGSSTITVSTLSNILLINGNQLDIPIGSYLMNSGYTALLDSTGTFTVPSLVSTGTATISNLVAGIVTGPGGMGGNAVLQAPSSNAAVMQNNSGFNELYVQDDGIHILLSESNTGIVFHGWDFNLDGSLTFPDTTMQTTAYDISYNVPASSTATGTIGQLATTGTNLYVCVASNSWLMFSGVTF